jgi:hypothetical protein
MSRVKIRKEVEYSHTIDHRKKVRPKGSRNGKSGGEHDCVNQVGMNPQNVHENIGNGTSHLASKGRIAATEAFGIVLQAPKNQY